MWSGNCLARSVLQDFPCLIQLLRTGLFVWFTSYTRNIFLPAQGWMSLFKFMLRTNSVISPLQIRYISFTVSLPVFSFGRRWDYKPRNRREQPWNMECPQQCRLTLEPAGSGIGECNQQSQQLEFNCPSRNWKQMNRLTEIYLPPDLSESTPCCLQ